ncbi:MAG: hypothetical protein Q8S84_03075 [bacterium]|nr:hypothetical protein [bacterium]MDP3380514.1 hypothetical protein [bacterium]
MLFTFTSLSDFLSLLKSSITFAISIFLFISIFQYSNTYSQTSFRL